MSELKLTMELEANLICCGDNLEVLAELPENILTAIKELETVTEL